MRVNSWAQWKSFVDSFGPNIDEIPLNKDANKILVEAWDGPAVRSYKLEVGSTDHTDYVTNYQAKAGKPNVTRPGAFSQSEGYKFRGTGVKVATVVTAGTTDNLDYKLTEARMLNGVHLFLENHVWADTVKLQVIDIDNILGYGANFIADEFGSDWNIDHTQCSQGREIIKYPAKVIAGLYVRIVLISTGATDVKMKANIYLHKVPV